VTEHSEHPWGAYDVLTDAADFKVKTIEVHPGQRLATRRTHVVLSTGSGRMVNAPYLVALVRAGARFERGVLIERPEPAAA